MRSLGLGASYEASLSLNFLIICRESYRRSLCKASYRCLLLCLLHFQEDTGTDNNNRPEDIMVIRRRFTYVFCVHSNHQRDNREKSSQQLLDVSYGLEMVKSFVINDLFHLHNYPLSTLNILIL